MTSAALASLYFSFLFQFSFTSHPVVYCMLLLCCCLSGTFYCYLFLGFSWYLLILSLVYIGGVYILFIFVSVHNPNPVTGAGLSLYAFVVSLLILFYVFFGTGSNIFLYSDQSHSLCSYLEGFTYCLLCLSLLLGFAIISSVSSDKTSFYR